MASWFLGCCCAMGDVVVTREMLAAKYGVILPHLDERQRRLLLGAEARALGHGGIRLVASAAGVREATVSRGAAESPLRWTTLSTRDLAGELAARGRGVSAETVHRLLRQQGFSLQANAK